LNENTRYIEAMPAKQQMSILSKINSGIKAQESERLEVKNKINSYKSAAQELGVEVSPAELLSAATGIKATDSPDKKVSDFAQVTGLDRDKMTPAIIAKVGFGVDLPGGDDIDMNKERLPDGGYTPKGIGAVIKQPYETAAATKVQVEKVLMQADEFINNNNKQAGLASMIAFQKLIDDGAAVREGDIKLSALGISAFDNLKLMMDRIGEGAIATPEQIQEMRKSASIFGQSVLESSKTYIDPYLEEAQARSYRMIDIGIPRSAYDSVFANIRTTEDENLINKKVQDSAKQYGMSVNEYLTATAQKHNITVEEVAKKIGYTGGIE
jgi:hypothetical protein